MDSTRHGTTLRDLAGLPTDPPPLADAILLVIDAQEAYTDTGDLTVDGCAVATERIVDLLTHARTAGTPIIHVAHRGAAGSAFDPLHGGRFIAASAPAPGEDVVQKSLPNAFAGTNLAELIDAIGNRPLVLCGFMTHMCVSSTARAALDRGLDTTVVSDATATRSLPTADRSSTVSADAVHEAALAALADRFSVVASTRQLTGA